MCHKCESLKKAEIHGKLTDLPAVEMFAQIWQGDFPSLQQFVDTHHTVMHGMRVNVNGIDGNYFICQVDFYHGDFIYYVSGIDKGFYERDLVFHIEEEAEA